MIKYLKENIDEEILVNGARYNWKKIKKNIMVINMFRHFGEEYIYNIFINKQGRIIRINPKDMKPSRYIINPMNTRLIIWGNLLLLLTIIYLFLLPLLVSLSSTLSKHNFGILFIFDMFFMANSFLKLFVGFANEQGDQET